MKKLIKPDNLSPKEKKKNIIKIFLLAAILLTFFYYKNSFEKETKNILKSNFGVTEARVIGKTLSKINGNEFEFYVGKKKYTYPNNNPLILYNNEYYKVKYSRDNPKICEIILTEPIIKDINDYTINIGKITNTESYTPNKIEFTYNYLGENYSRRIYVNDCSKYKTDKKYEIIINKKVPKIAYLKNMFNFQ
ncbi:hypothetical protein [Tenacibaculum sp. 190524A02b]|uniref:Uncharacterized protein n=1 Tax=Tenacibaculum vairaonense TaxID=3137860 RepID=A0ABM9PMM2_9FLAO